ncbi:hypothetical protein AB4Z54_16555, partial [Streptomyces sp. MCAF7]
MKLTAHQFQEWVDKAYEVRLTVVAHSLFAAEIHAGSDAARIDFRADYDSLTFKPCDVPEHIAGGVHMLMYTFGLQYVALDFLVTPQGDWYLVDVNPNGQWDSSRTCVPPSPEHSPIYLRAHTHDHRHTYARA